MWEGAASEPAARGGGVSEAPTGITIGRLDSAVKPYYPDLVLAPLTKLLKIPPARRLLAPHQIRFVSKIAKLRTNCSGRRTGKKKRKGGKKKKGC